MMNYGLHDVGALRYIVKGKLPPRWANRVVERLDELAGGHRWSEASDAFVRRLMQNVTYPLSINSHDSDVIALADEMAAKHEQLNGCSGVFAGLAKLEVERDMKRFELDDPGSARRQCSRWWLRALRHAVNEKTEIAARSFGYVGGRGDRYISNESYRRYLEREKHNQASVEAAEIVDEDGNANRLADAVQASVSNPEIRRAELMTRIRGFEEIAAGLNHVGIFLTATLPSRFHPVRANGSTNDNFDGSSVVDGQCDLCSKWAKYRARLAKDAIRIYGFRVAEPHKSGTVHWHILLFCDRASKRDVIRHFVQIFRDSDEVGEGETRKHRVKVKTMNPLLGGAAAYVAKYIAKNIDGAHMPDKEQSLAKRVRAWASIHRIRQFQQFGGPRVGVWRELRRVERDVLSSVSETHKQLADCVHRTDDTRADWAQFCRLTTNMTREPRKLLVALEKTWSDRQNAYSEPEGERIYGCSVSMLIFPTRTKRWRVHWNSRSKVATQPSRTRFNNCNPQNPKNGSASFNISVGFGAVPLLSGEGAVNHRSGVKRKSPGDREYGDSG